MDELKRLFDEGRHEDAWKRLYALSHTTSDYAGFSSLLRWRDRLSSVAARPEPARTVKVALLGGATTDLLERPLSLAVEATGLGCEFHQAPYNTFAQEMLVPDSDTAEFRPDVAVVITTPGNIPRWPSLGDDETRVCEIVEEVAEHFAQLCRTMNSNVGCEIVFSNFHPLLTRPLGAAGTKMKGEPNNFIAAVNSELARCLPAYVHINDVNALASYYGVVNWFDPRFWYLAKQPVSFECLVPLTRNIAQMIGAVFGTMAKCLVVDLDNTLWGGVVGDDGHENVVIGEGDAVAEAYKGFQEYLLRLKQRGVLLAACSKNEEENALAPFRFRQEMVLKEDDFAAFLANWTPKSQNLRTIAANLNIGLDALVFVDDNPAEREEVRQAVPEVKVIELPDDPARYAEEIDRSGWLEAVSLSSEDRQRSQLYQDNREREQLQESVGDYATYLRSLEQLAVIAPFEERYLERITQLTNKTNQFNLTTLRLGLSEIESAMRSGDHLTAFVRLSDKFGDNGLISVLLGRQAGSELWIDLWLMSCRVFGRGVERLVCNYLVDEARHLGVERIHGCYLPTAKNNLVRDHYPSMGFSASASSQCDGESWILDVASYEPLDVAIQVVEDY